TFIESLPNEQTITVAHDYLLVSDLGENNMLSDILAHDFTIVLPDALRERYDDPAKTLAKQLGKISGTSPDIVSDKTAANSYEILVGLTNRPESVEAEADLKYMDYRIRLAGDKIILTGGSALSTLTAMEHFAELLTSAELPALASGYEYHLDFHNTYLANLPAYDFDSFVPVWASEFTTPDWMLDYEEKLYAMTTQSGRFTSISHRADIQNYPCNSIGGILSALRLGIDVIELDVRLTKDNVMILMHDPTLSRTTNWEKMNGQNGLPTSCNVEDWTYAELLQLNLTYKGRETEFKVPTLYEAAALFKDRAQIWLDLKVGISREYDLFPLMEELGIKASCLYWLRMSGAKEWLQMNPGDTEYKAFIQKMTNYINRPGNKLRSSSYSKVGRYGDDPEGWKMQFTTGSKMVFTNRVYDLCRYIAENQAPIYP
ncbi:MAG: glycerophosphodiester phosphodiesterase family protein, partial [Clostridia bacterium]|nr:glycerophosphodiester phosphodiesterase family protein [Clostridia bacterium]